MSFPSRQVPFVGPAWRWLMWSVYGLAWTTVLLTPQPVHVAEAVLSSSIEFFTAKCLHIGAYAGLTMLTGWLQVVPRYRWLLLLFVSAHAFGTEFLQGFVPERYPSLRDIGFDHLGIVVGLALTWRWWLAASQLGPVPRTEMRSSEAI